MKTRRTHNGKVLVELPIGSELLRTDYYTVGESEFLFRVGDTIEPGETIGREYICTYFRESAEQPNPQPITQPAHEPAEE